MITVLTPTYNRAHTLTRAFQSLNLQHDLNFEWLIVDDGSTDDTKELIEKLSSQALFKIRYFYQNNSGKHVAINTGCKHALQEWILILDSDDVLTLDAIATVSEAVKKNETANTVGFCFRKCYLNGSLIGETKNLPSPVFLHPTEAGNFLKGDLAYVFRRKQMQEHPFPVIEGEKFVPELYIWNKIGDEGKIIFYLNKAIYLCEYLADGYTMNFSKNLKQNPQGFLIYYKSQFFREKSVVRKIKCAVRSLQCLCYSLSKI